MNFTRAALLALASTRLASAAKKNPTSCRFALDWSQDQVLSDTDNFISEVLYWEGGFHQDGIAYNEANGMSYDGSQIDWITGEATEKHTFSAASKESLHVMVLAHALAGDSAAARLLAPHAPSSAEEIAYGILEQKLQTYLQFNRTYPGFGGYLPWYNNTYATLSPTSDWVNRVPALDNGELLWAVYAAVQVLESSPKMHLQVLGQQWQTWLDYTKENAARVFYRGNGTVCAVTNLNQSLSPTDPGQNYPACNGVLNDQYEGELFTWWLYFFGGLPAADKAALWDAKRPQLVNVEYNMHGIGPITVQMGFWFSSHEQWKVLEMPYYDVDIVKRVYTNAERVRTCNSATLQIPGMYASTATQSVASFRRNHRDLATPRPEPHLARYFLVPLDLRSTQNQPPPARRRRDGQVGARLAQWPDCRTNAAQAPRASR